MNTSRSSRCSYSINDLTEQIREFVLRSTVLLDKIVEWINLIQQLINTSKKKKNISPPFLPTHFRFFSNSAYYPVIRLNLIDSTEIREESEKNLEQKPIIDKRIKI